MILSLLRSTSFANLIELLMISGWNSSAANATKFQKYLAAENGGGADLVANCTSASASGWETFKVRCYI